MMHLLKPIKKLDDIIGAFLMAFIVLLACANVFMRYVYGEPWGWVEEITITIFIWLIMFGASAVVMAEGHCSIDVLARKLPPKARQILDITVDLTTIATLGLLIWYGILLSIKGANKITPILGIPYTYIDASIPVCCSIMTVYYVRMLWIDITSTGQHKTQLEELIDENALHDSSVEEK